MASVETHNQIRSFIEQTAGVAQAQGNKLLQGLAVIAGALQTMVIELEANQANAAPSTVTNNEITVNGSATIQVANQGNGARIFHGLNLPNILVSAKDEEGYQDPYTSGRADGPDHLILRTPANEFFTGTLIIDPLTLIQS